MNDQQEELWQRLESVRTTMMTTQDIDGVTLRSRPMWTQGDDFDGTLWFFAPDDGALAQELEENGGVALAYAAPDKDLYVSVSGRAKLVRDRGKAEELWNVFADAWFPGGVDDPHLALVRVDVDRAQYWEDKKPKVIQFAEMVVGAIRDRPPKSGDERKLDFGSGTSG